MGDDGEKFGGWPTTFEHCWGPTGWVERFFAALEVNRDWFDQGHQVSGLAHDHGPVGGSTSRPALRGDGRVGIAGR